MGFEQIGGNVNNWPNADNNLQGKCANDDGFTEMRLKMRNKTYFCKYNLTWWITSNNALQNDKSAPLFPESASFMNSPSSDS